MKKILIFLSFVAIFSMGCKKDFLETKPTASISAIDAFSTADRVVAAMNGLYDRMTVSTYYTQQALTTDIEGEDMVLVSTGNYSRFVTEYRHLQSPTVGYGVGFWQYGWQLISNANQAIKNLPISPITDAQKKEYLAEARTLRAWAYHQLIRTFAQPYSVDPNSIGLPKLETPLGPNDVLPARESVKTIYEYMLGDLLFAKDNIPTSRKSTYKVNLQAINGMLARVYLDMENWAKASEYAKLARTGFPLAAGSTLLNGFVDPTSEWIWTLDYRSDDNTGYVQVASFQEPYDIGYSTFRATPEFLALFDNNDIRQKQFWVNETKVATYAGDALKRDKPLISRDGYLMNKFWFRDAWDLDVPLMRTAEMYLIEAEAEAELGNDGPARTALFEVQKRAITGATISVNSGAVLKQEIQIERRKELYGEGFRYYDILRRKETLTRTSPNHWAKLTLASGDPKRIMPIPQSEREASGMKQNLGYPD